MQYYANTWLANTDPGNVKIPFAVHIENPTVSIDKVEQSNIIVYPNPTNASVTVHGLGLEGMEYTLINTYGEIVQSGIITNTDFLIDLHGLGNTTYILQINDGKKFYRNYRIVKI